MRRIVVNDTNLFIDLMDISLLNEFFSLPWEVHTTDFVVLELTKEGQKELVTRYFEDNVLHIAVFDPKEFMEIIALKRRFTQKTNVSLTDCSVLYYAKKNGYALLTGGRKLRHCSIQDGVEVHGIIYVFDALFEEGVVAPEMLAEKLQMLQNINPRLPKEEIEKRLLIWNDKQNKKEGRL